MRCSKPPVFLTHSFHPSIRDSLVLRLACFVVECSVDSVVESPADRLAGAMNPLRSGPDVAADSAACVDGGVLGRVWICCIRSECHDDDGWADRVGITQEDTKRTKGLVG